MMFTGNWMRKSMLATAGAVVVMGVGSGASAQLIPGEKIGAHITDPGFTGVTQFDGWLAQRFQDEELDIYLSTLSEAYNQNVARYPGTGPWSNPIPSYQGSPGHDARITKVANGATPQSGVYPGSNSLYFSGHSLDQNAKGATIAISDPTPVLDLAKVVFQIEIGEYAVLDFWDGDGDFTTKSYPTLNYNDGDQRLDPTVALRVHREPTGGKFQPPSKPGEPEPPAQDLYNNTYWLEWDLSGIADITSFEIRLTAVEHAQVWAMRLDQFSVIPEPTSLGLAGMAGMLLLTGRRRRT